MKYISQLDYPTLPYPTTLTQEAPLAPPYPSVAVAGCGIVCACMLIRELSGQPFQVEDAVALSMEAGANHFGTDMKRLAPFIAQRYHLYYAAASDSGALLECLDRGGLAVLHAGKPFGAFSDGGHFVLAVKRSGDRISIMDPSYTREKYEKEYRRGKVEIAGNCVIASVATVIEETKNRDPSYYLFWKDALPKP